MIQPGLIKAVIIDDENNAILLLEEMLSKIDGVNVAGHAVDVQSGVSVVLKHQPDIIFLDIRLKDERAFDLIRILKENDINATIVLVTAYDQYGLQAIKAGAFDYLLKPVDPDELTKVITRFRQKMAKHHNN